MSVVVIGPAAAIEVARRGDPALPDGVEVFAPTLLRSQVLALCRRDVATGALARDEALELAERACRLPRRLLGDAVLRRTAWRLAEEHGWPDTYDAEYVALTRLHGDALVASSPELVERASGVVEVRSVADLLGGT